MLNLLKRMVIALERIADALEGKRQYIEAELPKDAVWVTDRDEDAARMAQIALREHNLGRPMYPGEELLEVPVAKELDAILKESLKR